LGSGSGKVSLQLKKASKSRSGIESNTTESVDDVKKSFSEELENASSPPALAGLSEKTDPILLAPSFGDILIPVYSFTSSHREFGLKNLMKTRRIVKSASGEAGVAANEI
jgi:hypothetical protein